MATYKPISPLVDSATDRGKVERVKLSGPADSTEQTEWVAGVSQLAATGYTGAGQGLALAVPGVTHVGPIGSSNAGQTANTLKFFYFVIASPITITSVHCEVSVAAAGNMVMGIYNAACVNGVPYPTSLVATWGTVSTGTTGIKTISSLSTVLLPGQYALAYNTDAATSQLRSMQYYGVQQKQIVNSGSSNICNAVVQAYVASTYSATLPSTFPAGPPSYGITANASGQVWCPVWVGY